MSTEQEGVVSAKWDHQCACGVVHASFAQELDCINIRLSGCTPEEAKVVRARIGDRLAGHTHAEVAEMHPMPSTAPHDQATGMSDA